MPPAATPYDAVESSSLDPSFYLYPPLQIASALAHAYYGVPIAGPPELRAQVQAP